MLYVRIFSQKEDAHLRFCLIQTHLPLFLCQPALRKFQIHRRHMISLLYLQHFCTTPRSRRWAF